MRSEEEEGEKGKKAMGTGEERCCVGRIVSERLRASVCLCVRQLDINRKGVLRQERATSRRGHTLLYAGAQMVLHTPYSKARRGGARQGPHPPFHQRA